MTENTEVATIRTIAILGGTGKEGKGLGYRWAKAGYRVLIGSRSEEKARAAVEDLRGMLGSVQDLAALTNDEAARQADLVVLTVPFGVHKTMCEQLKDAVQGKILIDVAVPLVPPKVTKVQMPPAGSAAMEAKEVLGDAVQVVAAFQNISYEHLLKDEKIECDVLVCGGNKASRQVVLKLVSDAGLIGWDAGVIENSVVVEGMTSILIGLNKQFGIESAGIRITGVPRPDEN
ncbi:reduced coenzyme F420:NADP oxidoreductase [Longilinea arvoryzae]|uniref:Reduced coenzyme F420:NADP oxidoreductase n=1 Tax=Longilinea arvoryzae TaxID=360412 RepID=A0A0S7BJP7_9CHLR|nr:NADPH-dependent F420 reductase [Longilinea arvoryzae]GAP14710.1 reduced coenzyme F420:NADP oxidoreductase [Longilinea arvoryzae]